MQVFDGKGPVHTLAELKKIGLDAFCSKHNLRAGRTGSLVCLKYKYVGAAVVARTLLIVSVPQQPGVA